MVNAETVVVLPVPTLATVITVILSSVVVTMTRMATVVITPTIVVTVVIAMSAVPAWQRLFRCNLHRDLARVVLSDRI